MNTQGYPGVVATTVTQITNASLAGAISAFNTSIAAGNVPIAPLQKDSGANYTIVVGKPTVGGPKYTGGTLLETNAAGLSGAMVTAVGTRRFVMGQMTLNPVTDIYLCIVLFTI